MQVQLSQQTLFNFLFLEQSKFPPKKFYNINFWPIDFGIGVQANCKQEAILDLSNTDANVL